MKLIKTAKSKMKKFFNSKNELLKSEFTKSQKASEEFKNAIINNNTVYSNVLDEMKINPKNAADKFEKVYKGNRITPFTEKVKKNETQIPPPNNITTKMAKTVVGGISLGYMANQLMFNGGQQTNPQLYNQNSYGPY